jgi:hypothetical protein
MSQMTEAQLKTKESLARDFLEIARKILPGLSRLKVALNQPLLGTHASVFREQPYTSST